MRLAAAYLSGKSVYVRRALDRVVYSERIHQMTTGYAEDIVTADYTCLKLYYEQNGLTAQPINRIQAENLRVYALTQVSELKRKKPIGASFPAWAIGKVKLASACFTLAQAMIESYRTPDRPSTEPEVLAASLQRTTIDRLWDDLEARIQATGEIARKLEGEN